MKNKLSQLLMLFLLLLSLSTGNLRASDIKYNFKQLSIGEGLSHSAVTSVLKDSKGNLWIGTRSGLNLLDQDEIHIYLQEKKNDQSLPSNHIFFVMEDSLQNVWVSTTKGLVRYLPDSDSFMPIIGERVYHFLPIPGGILFSGDNCLYRYDIAGESYETIPVNPAIIEPGWEQYKVFRLQWLNSSRLLLSTKNEGLLRFDLNSNRIEQLPFGKEQTMTASHVDREGNIYCSFYNLGLFCYNKEGKLQSHYTTRNSELSYDIILDIIEREGELWLATDGGGITIFDPEEKSMHTLRHIPGDPSSLPVNSVSLLYSDPDHDLWAGTVRGGLFQIKETYIRVYRDVALNNRNGLSEKVIISLFEDSDSILWIGTDGGGINKYNPFTDHFTHFLGTYGDKVVSITDLSEEELLVSLYGKGVFAFSKRTGSYRPFTIVNDSIHQQECFDGYMPLLHRVNSDQIAILSQYAYIYHPSTHSFTPVTTAGDPHELGALNLQYADGQHLFLSKDNKVYTISGDTYELTRLLSLNDSETIHSVCYDGKKILWIGSDRGLSYYDLEKEELQHIETKMFNEISYLFYDDRSRLWISAQNRLFSYIIPQNRFVIWGESEGFTANEILFMYQQKSRTNNIYLGGTNGLVIIDKNISYNVRRDETVGLIDLLFNGKSFLQAYNERQRSINIPGNYTSLSVTMGLKEKDIFSQTLYRYSISGLSTQYTETYNRRIKLPQLPPGSYSIMASYITSSGEWSQPSSIITLHIRPPWYRSNWFILSMILLTLLIIYGVTTEIIRRNRYKLILEKNEIEQSVNEEKIRFLVNVSHELRTPLTLIYAPLRRLLQNADNAGTGHGQLREQLNLIFGQAVLMKNIINMVLDLNKLNTGYDTIVKQYHPLNSWIREVADDFRNEIENKQIRLHLEMDPELDQVPFDLNKTRIVLSNLLMNAIKFSERETTITVKTKKEDDLACVTVSDEGMGLKGVDTNRLFSRFYQGPHGVYGSGIGLSYSRALIEKHGGTIGVRDHEGKGATFFFYLPLKDTDTHTATVNEQVTNPTAAFNSVNSIGAGLDTTNTPPAATVSKHAVGAVLVKNNISATGDAPSDNTTVNISATGTHNASGNVSGRIPSNGPVTQDDPAAVGDIDLRNYSLLVVEDNPDFLRFLQESLTGLFKSVRGAANGVSAIAQIEQEQPAIVVSDVMMPEMDGFELCRRIKTTLDISHIPVILLTAKSDTESMETGYKQGADFYITKPFDLEFLLLITTNLLTARESVKEKYKQSPGWLLPEEVTISSADEVFLHRLNKLISDNLSNPDLNVNFLASEIAMSRSSLYNKMNHLLDMGVNDYINTVRIAKAVCLLKQTEMTIGDIATDTGFKNQRYFSTFFRQIKGVSPTEFRKTE